MAASSDPSTLYMPVLSPPTPAPSPRPQSHGTSSSSTFLDINDPFQLSRREFASLSALGPSLRRQYLAALLADCNPSELLFISTTIAPLLKRDFLKELPAELALHVLRFVDEPKTLARAGQVSRYWCGLLKDESLWRRMCCLHRYVGEVESVMDVDEKSEMSRDEEEDEEEFQQLAAQSGSTWTSRHNRRPEGHPSYHSLFKYSFATGTSLPSFYYFDSCLVALLALAMMHHSLCTSSGKGLSTDPRICVVRVPL